MRKQKTKNHLMFREFLSNVWLLIEQMWQQLSNKYKLHLRQFVYTFYMTKCQLQIFSWLPIRKTGRHQIRESFEKSNKKQISAWSSAHNKWLRSKTIEKFNNNWIILKCEKKKWNTVINKNKVLAKQAIHALHTEKQKFKKASTAVIISSYLIICRENDHAGYKSKNRITE